MSFIKIRDTLIPIVTVCAILLTSAVVIAYGRGYRLDITQKSLQPTGLLAATSDPNGAQILVNGKLMSATNNTINIDPGSYQIAIAKEGYQTWEKQIGIKGEVVSRADAYLFPTNPSLSAITNSGVNNPVLSPDGSKLAFVIPNSPVATSDSMLVNRTGIWILELTDRPLGMNRDARQMVKSDIVDFSDSILFWSPDSKEILASVTHPLTKVMSYYLLETDKLNDTPIKVFNLDDINNQWDQLSQVKDKERLSGLPQPTADAINQFMKVINFSPDENKILYEASISGILPKLIKPALIGTNSTEEHRNIQSGSIYVYDIKEDRNYLIGDTKDLLPKLSPTPKPIAKVQITPTPFSQPPLNPTLQWLATNRHLLFITKGKIEVMDYDDTNLKTIYSGPFWDNFVVPWTNASKILILTTLNPAAGTLPNIYAVNLR